MVEGEEEREREAQKEDGYDAEEADKDKDVHGVDGDNVEGGEEEGRKGKHES